MNGGCDAGAPRSTPPCGPCTLGESSRSAARRERFARVTERRSDDRGFPWRECGACMLDRMPRRGRGSGTVVQPDQQQAVRIRQPQSLGQLADEDVELLTEHPDSRLRAGTRFEPQAQRIPQLFTHYSTIVRRSTRFCTTCHWDLIFGNDRGFDKSRLPIDQSANSNTLIKLR
jgi:hypothetical protein